MIERIVSLMDYLNMTAAQFADRIAVQPSSISHILAGRNKPSLEFIQKVIRQFPEISTDWLIFGKGEMLTGLQERKRQKDGDVSQSGTPGGLQAAKPSVDKVILCYSDGTFSLYSQDNDLGINR